jgi:hypothetical protein
MNNWRRFGALADRTVLAALGTFHFGIVVIFVMIPIILSSTTKEPAQKSKIIMQSENPMQRGKFDVRKMKCRFDCSQLFLTFFLGDTMLDST